MLFFGLAMSPVLLMEFMGMLVVVVGGQKNEALCVLHVFHRLVLIASGFFAALL